MSSKFITLIPDPDLQDLLNLHKREIMLSMNCHAIATVQSFDSANQTVQATVNYTKTYSRMNPDGTTYDQEVPYPVLMDCPVIILGGGACSLTFPIAEGDQCLILFNDRDIDNWFEGNPPGPVATNRLHSFSDGIALIGLPDISSYDEDRALLSNGTVKLGINPETNKITAENGQSLNEVLTNLTTILSNLMTALTTAFALPAVPTAPLDPTWVASTATIVAAISAAASDIGDLLE